MTTLKHATLELNSFNSDGSTVVLYFDSAPTAEEVIASCNALYGKLPLSVDTQDDGFHFERAQSPVSQAAGFHRVECYPAG